MKKLLKEGADVNGAQGDGMTALHWAALNGDAELASMLLFAGANVGAKTRIGGYTPLHLAAQVGHASVIAPLVAAGAQVGAADRHRRHGADAGRAFGQHRFGAHPARERLRSQRQGNRERPDRADVRRGGRSRRRRQAAAVARRRSQRHLARRGFLGADDEQRRRSERRAASAGAAAAGRQGHPRRHAAVQLQRIDRQARRPRGAALCRAAGRDGHRRGAAQGRREHQPARRRRPDHADHGRGRSTATSIWSATCSTTAPIRTSPAKAASRRSMR